MTVQYKRPLQLNKSNAINDFFLVDLSVAFQRSHRYLYNLKLLSKLSACVARSGVTLNLTFCVFILDNRLLSIISVQPISQ